MKTQSIMNLLSLHPFFNGFSQEDIEFISKCGKNSVFHEDQLILESGQIAKEFYLIRSGNVAIEIHVPHRGNVILQTLGEGEVIGWSWLFPPYRWTFDARALSAVHAIVINGECLRSKCESDTRLGFILMKKFAEVMVERLQATRFQLLDIYSNGRDNKKGKLE